MQEEPQNHGGAPKAEEDTGAPRRGMSPGDERIWAALSHASVLVWPITGFLPVAPLVIWLLCKDRSARAGFHALQSLWYQVAWLVIFTVAGAVSSVLLFATFGIAILVLVPLWILLGPAPFVHQLYAAYKTGRGEDYRYPFIANRL